MNKKSRGRWLLTFIFAVGSLLTISALAFAENVVTTNTIGVSSYQEKYSNLYTQPPQEVIKPQVATVYLTFDDGPSKNTEKVLDVLKKAGVKATFFVSAQDEDTEFIKKMLVRMVEEGHTIALHSYSHEYSKIYKSVDSYLADIDKLNDLIIEATGVCPNIIRFPGGSTSTNASPRTMRKITDEMTRRGYVFYDWTIVSKDDTTAVLSPEKICSNIFCSIKDPNRKEEIILFHDNPGAKTTPQATKLVIASFEEMGYLFDRIENTTPTVEFINKIY